MRARSAICLFMLIVILSPFQARTEESRQTLKGHLRLPVSSVQAKLLSALPQTQRLHVSLVLPLRNESGLKSLLANMYDPSSPDYRHFLSADQFTEQFSPSQKDYQAVVDFAGANGLVVTTRYANRLVVPVSGSVDQIEKAFHVRMNVYQHPTENRTFYSPNREPSIDLAVPVAHIAGLSNFSVPQPQVKRVDPNTGPKSMSGAVSGSGPGGAYLGSDMRAAYYGGKALTGAGQTVGLVEFDGYYLSDVNRTFGSAGQSYSVPVKNVLLDGATGAPTSGNDIEQSLDIAQAIGMAPGLSQVRVYIGSVDVDILNAIANENLAQQVSISWSWVPDDPAVDDIFFMEFAAQGQSVFVASGDNGAFDPVSDNFYPGEDTYVTSVGGSDLVTGGAGGRWISETAWNGSEGGISPDSIAIPAWQTGIANSANHGSTSLRNVPDVAMEANDSYACGMGVCSAWAGTSFAAPRWAGFMALVNQQNAASGNPTVGFFNPTLYALGKESAYASDFHDIAVGNNSHTSNCCSWPYYNAVPGYDLVTGWGSPAGQGLIDSLVPKTLSDFELSVPGSGLIYPGNSTSDILRILWHGSFNQPVHLSASDLPAGVTATFDDPVPAPAGQYVGIILSVNSSAKPGPYLLKVTGTSGTSTATTYLALQIAKPFTMFPSPAKLTIPAGGSGSSVIFTNGAGPINFAVTGGLPDGVNGTWLFDSETGTHALSISVSKTVPAGTRAMLGITGYANGEAETTHIALIVGPSPPGLSISPTPTALAQGASSTSTVSVVPAGNYGVPLLLSAPSLPPGVKATFNPASTSTTSTLTLTAGSSAPLGTGSVLINGTSPTGNVAGYSFLLNVSAKPVPAFALGASIPARTLEQGASAHDTISINPTGGFTGPVTLSIGDGVPIGVTASFSANPATLSSVLTFTASRPAVPGTSRIVVVGVSGSLQSVMTFYLTVNPPPTFSLSSSPAVLAVKQGGSVTSTLSTNPGTGFNGYVGLSALSLPAGVTASFSPSSTTRTSLLTLKADTTTVPGTYNVILSGAWAGFTTTAVIPLNVQFVAPIRTTTTLAPFSANPYPGGAACTLTATVAPAGGTGTVPGNVVFHIGSATQTVPLNALNTAIYKFTTQDPPGTVAFSANYQGSSEFTPSASAVLTEMIAGATKTVVTMSPASSTIPGGSTYTVTAKVSSIGSSLIPIGTIDLKMGNTIVTLSLNSSGVATYTGTVPDSGYIWAEAFYYGQYSGPKLFAGSHASTTIQTIIPASKTVLSISPAGQLTAGSLYTLTARVSAAATTGTPSGNVIFHLGSLTQTVALRTTGATLTARAPLAAGSLSLSAVYEGSQQFATSTSNTLTETIKAIATTTALSISPTGPLTAGSPYTLTAKVAPAGSNAVVPGNIVFHIGSVTQTVSLGTSNTVVYHGVAPSAAGSLSISSVYQGTAEYAPSTSNTLTETIKAIATTTALSITPTGPLTADSAYTLTAKVSPTGSTAVVPGNIVFHIGSVTQTVSLGTSNIAVYHGVAPSAAGSLLISSLYQGTAEYAPSTSNTLTETVKTLATTTALCIPPSGPFTDGSAEREPSPGLASAESSCPR